METREQRTKRDEAAQFAAWVNTLHMIIVQRLRFLTRRAELAKTALNACPECEPAWNALANFYYVEAELFGALDALSFEKVSPWLESPMTREKLAAAYADAGERSGARNAA